MSSDFYRSFPGVATVIDQAVEDIFRTPQSLTAVTDAAVDLVRESFPSLSGKDEERLYSTVADEVARRRQYLFWDPEPSDATCFDPLSFKFSFPATEDNPSTFSSGSPVFRGAQIGPSYTSQHGIHSTLGKADEALGRGDVFLAERLASPLALNGDTASQIFLADLYTKTDDLQKAKYWLRVSVSQGAEDCLFNLATIYFQEGNYKAAELALFRLAVEGQVDAQAQLGTVYLQADQFQEAEKWLSRAADAGNEIASENLAIAYEKIGLQLVKSGRPAEAVKYYELSARRGSSKAEFNLGELYEDGTGLGDRNSLLAASWYLLAVNNPKGKFSKATWMLGNPGWQLICGQLLRFGAYHHAPNPESAKQYLEAARAQGEPGAARYLEEMVTLDPGYLSPETIHHCIYPEVTIWTTSLIDVLNNCWPLQTFNSDLSLRFSSSFGKLNQIVPLDDGQMELWLASYNEYAMDVSVSRTVFTPGTAPPASRALQTFMDGHEKLLTGLRYTSLVAWPHVHPSAALRRGRGFNKNGFFQSATALALVKGSVRWMVTVNCQSAGNEEYGLAMLHGIAV